MLWEQLEQLLQRFIRNERYQLLEATRNFTFIASKSCSRVYLLNKVSLNDDFGSAMCLAVFPVRVQKAHHLRFGGIQTVPFHFLTLDCRSFAPEVCFYQVVQKYSCLTLLVQRRKVS